MLLFFTVRLKTLVFIISRVLPNDAVYLKLNFSFHRRFNVCCLVSHNSDSSRSSDRPATHHQNSWNRSWKEN